MSKEVALIYIFSVRILPLQTFCVTINKNLTTGSNKQCLNDDCDLFVYYIKVFSA